ncbi:tRNA (guanine-N(7)-)-methyltransferase non-catalytic subunit wdr4, partial [Aphidius gifuensis]
MSFSVHGSFIIVCSCENILIYNINNGEESILKIPNINIITNTSNNLLKQHNNSDVDTCHGITSIEYSNDGKYICLCTNRKQLCLYDRLNNNKLVSNRTLIRAASRVRLTPNNDIIVADKSGDAYLYSLSKPDEPGKLILGHLSMLLDVLVTKDNKYIITADRDEKIRVSKFKNSYNIQSFCLGHTKFVSNICQLPHDSSIIASAGGDGFVKFWQYKNGQEMNSINYSDKIKCKDIVHLNESLNDLELTDPIETLPVKHLISTIIPNNNNNNNSSSLILLTFYGSGLVLLYKITGSITIVNDNDNIKFLQSIIIDDEPIQVHFANDKLWMLLKSGVQVYKFNNNDEMFIQDIEYNDKLDKLNKSWIKLENNVNNQIFYPILYKRKFDNVQEYKEKKKSR